MSERSFSTPEAVAASGVNGPVLHYWCKTGFVTPSVKKGAGTGSRRRWSYEDLLALRVAKCLREIGVPLSGMRAAVRLVQRGFDAGRYGLMLLVDVPDDEAVFARYSELLEEASARLLVTACVVVDMDLVREEVNEAIVGLIAAAAGGAAR